MLIGALVTLAVTVLGGLIVYYSTQEDLEPRVEKLTYQKDEQVSFYGRSNKLAIGTLKFANIGRVSAKNVSLVVTSMLSDFIELNVSASNGAKLTAFITDDKNKISITVPSLLPDEIITVTYLLERESTVDLSLRSDETIGSEGPIYTLSNSNSKKSILNNFLGDFVPFLIVIPIALLFFAKKYYDNNSSRSTSKNNTAFVLLHSKLINKAEQIFRRSILNGEDGAHCLANYAGTLGCLNRIEEAKSYLFAAKFLAVTKHEKAIVAFNEAIIYFHEDDIDASIKAFENAIALSDKEIKMYSSNSLIINEMKSKSITIKDLLP